MACWSRWGVWGVGRFWTKVSRRGSNTPCSRLKALGGGYSIGSASCHRPPQMDQKGAQGAPKGAQRASKCALGCPLGTQGRPRVAQGSPQDRPRGAQEIPQSHLEGKFLMFWINFSIFQNRPKWVPGGERPSRPRGGGGRRPQPPIWGNNKGESTTPMTPKGVGGY